MQSGPLKPRKKVVAHDVESLHLRGLLAVHGVDDCNCLCRPGVGQGLDLVHRDAGGIDLAVHLAGQLWWGNLMIDNIPVCLPCSVDMTCDKNGVLLVQFCNQGNPLIAVFADRYRCRYCGHQVVTNRASMVVWSRASGFPLDELGGLKMMEVVATYPSDMKAGELKDAAIAAIESGAFCKKGPWIVP